MFKDFIVEIWRFETRTETILTKLRKFLKKMVACSRRSPKPNMWGLPWRHFFRGRSPRSSSYSRKEFRPPRRAQSCTLLPVQSCSSPRSSSQATVRHAGCVREPDIGDATNAMATTTMRTPRRRRRHARPTCRVEGGRTRTWPRSPHLPSCLLDPRLRRRRCFRREPVAHLQLVHAHSAQQCLRRYARARNHLELAPELAVNAR